MTTLDIIAVLLLAPIIVPMYFIIVAAVWGLLLGAFR